MYRVGWHFDRWCLPDASAADTHPRHTTKTIISIRLLPITLLTLLLLLQFDVCGGWCGAPLTQTAGHARPPPFSPPRWSHSSSLCTSRCTTRPCTSCRSPRPHHSASTRQSPFPLTSTSRGLLEGYLRSILFIFAVHNSYINIQRTLFKIRDYTRCF